MKPAHWIFRLPDRADALHQLRRSQGPDHHLAGQDRSEVRTPWQQPWGFPWGFRHNWVPQAALFSLIVLIDDNFHLHKKVQKLRKFRLLINVGA
jgi:hypothetical protein